MCMRMARMRPSASNAISPVSMRSRACVSDIRLSDRSPTHLTGRASRAAAQATSASSG